MSESESGKNSHAELREYVFGDLPKQDESPVNEWAGEIQDPDVRAYLSFAAEVVEDDQVFDDFANEVRRMHGTDAVHDAIVSGNMAHAEYFSGLVGYQTDVSGMQTLMSLQSMVEDIPVFIGYVFGLMGSGKTDFALLLVEVFKSVYGRDSVYTAANVSSDDLDEEVTQYSRVVEMLEDRRDRIQSGESPDPVVIVVDEAAQIFTGSGADQHRAKQLAKILKLARKSNANVILIGQDGKDIGPSLRALCTAFVHKESQKKAVFYQDVQDRQGRHEMMSLSGVPPTDIDYSTWDEGEFEFDEEEEDLPTESEIAELEADHEREMMAILSVTTDLTQEEIGDIYSVSEKTVRRAKSKFEGKLEDIGVVDG